MIHVSFTCPAVAVAHLNISNHQIGNQRIIRTSVQQSSGRLWDVELGYQGILLSCHLLCCHPLSSQVEVLWEQQGINSMSPSHRGSWHPKKGCRQTQRCRQIIQKGQRQAHLDVSIATNNECFFCRMLLECREGLGQSVLQSAYHMQLDVPIKL